ncbi:MAG: hypothetical protein ABF293_07385 [Flavobacteriaceae bacterium]
MRKNYAIPLGIVLITAITFWCTSYIPSQSYPITFDPEPGHFEMVVSGTNELYLSGSVVLDTTRRVSVNGNSYPEIRLRLKGDGAAHNNFIDLFLATPELSYPLSGGTYAVTENVKGLFRDFDGVFGFADLYQFGEIPFFSKEGKISIVEANNQLLLGSLKMELGNTLGEVIEIEGNFVTYREP